MDIGPQKVGGRYLCGYWQLEYTVKAITDSGITVEWADGTVTAHGTPWDARRDVVISQPAQPPASATARDNRGRTLLPLEVI